MLRKPHGNSRSFRLLAVLFSGAALAIAAPPSRITRPVDASRTVFAPGRVHHLAQAQFDQGAVDPKKQLNYMVLLMKPSPAQQADLDALLMDQQNPSSKNFHQWLTPEQFGSRFGLNSSDQSKVVAWLTAQGFSVDHVARSNNWVAFSGSADKVSTALHTPIHQFQVNGKMHFANTQVPSIPAALSDIAGGFLGLNDFPTHSNAKIVTPDYTTGNTHYLAPADFATIYDVSPLYTAGIDGTGQSIAIVGESDVLLSDIATFRTRYGLPANVPKLIPYSNTDPGYNGAELEGNLDLEWAGAIAPKATIYYVYGPSAFTAIVYAVEVNAAPIISASYSSCEIDADYPGYSSLAQQGNAQGITLLAASGDAGAAGCDSQGSEPFATRGLSVNFPAVLPEVTGVGGTQFVEGTGTYWGATNSSTFGSALSYIPEAAWNESATSGLGSTGGGVSQLYSQPAWQNGPGVPSDNFRHVPDVSFTAAGHDGYFITYLGSNSTGRRNLLRTPALAGVLALLNHYQVTNKFQKTPGLGNINPQLYRLAQAAPTAFHDVTRETTWCSARKAVRIASPARSATRPVLLMIWPPVSAPSTPMFWSRSGTQPSTARSSRCRSNVAKATLNDTVQLTATVTAGDGQRHAHRDRQFHL